MAWYLVSATGPLALRPGGEYSVGSAPWCDVVVTDAWGVEDRHLIVRLTADGLSWHVMDTSTTGSATAQGRFQSRSGTDALSLQLGGAEGPYVALTTSPSYKLASAPRAVWPRTRSASGGDRVRYGRALDNDVVLDSPLASLYHCVVTKSGGLWTIVDEGSARGTLVNGERVSKRVLTPGDWVTMGGQPFRVDGDGELVAVKLQNGVPLKIRGLTVKAGGATLLNSVDLDIPPKALVAVVGPSGSGKSTFLRAVSGLRPADGGTVLIDGQDLYQGYADWRFRIGVVPQDDLVPPQLTVGHAMDFAARLRFPTDTARGERETRVREVLNELKLSERRNLRIDRLSGGQRKRVNVALELLTRPPLLFLDEPTSGLDPGLDQQLMMMLKELVEGGRTVVVVTHSMDNLNLCDRVLVLATGGHVAYWGPPKEAFSYFQVTDWPGVFLALDSVPGSEWTQRYRAWLKARRAEQNAKAGTAKKAPKKVRRVPLRGGAASSGWSQWATLVSRTWRVTVSDRATLSLIVALPLVLAVLGILVGSPFGLGPGDNPAPTNPDANILLLVLILGATFMGAATSIQALVQERVIYHRERTVGLSRPAYVLSKAVVLGGIALVQGTIFAALSLVGRPGPVNWYFTGWSAGDVILIIAMLSFCSCMLGLLLSTLLPNLDASLPVLVIVTMLQVVLSGAIRLRWGAIDEVFGPFVPASWAFDALASLTDLSTLMGPAAHDSWDATIGPVWTGVVAMTVMSAVFIALATWRQGSADPGRSSR